MPGQASPRVHQNMLLPLYTCPLCNSSTYTVYTTRQLCAVQSPQWPLKLSKCDKANYLYESPTQGTNGLSSGCLLLKTGAILVHTIALVTSRFAVGYSDALEVAVLVEQAP